MHANIADIHTQITKVHVKGHNRMLNINPSPDSYLPYHFQVCTACIQAG